MPLYTDSNFYYSGGSSQLYSPYYPSTPYSSSTTSAYSPYSSTYNRTISGSYVVPLTPPRSPSSYSATHGLSSRYQPKLTTITETSPLISSSRHGLMPLTRIQSPKYSPYSAPSTNTSSSIGSKYIPPRPILINTADIDVSAARYRRRKEAELKEETKQKDTPKSTSQSPSATPSPSGSVKKRGSIEKPKDTSASNNAENSADRRSGRSTIRRNRPVVRLSIIRSRSREHGTNGNEPEPQFHDLPHYTAPAQDQNLGWRQKLADDLANIPAFPIKKSPGDLMRERYLIQEDKPIEAPKRDYSKISGSPQPIEQVVVELDPLHHTIRRLSLPKCPTFHDICEDISSDKIDDDLNAGELRRRASLIQEQEQEMLNKLQKSASGTFQLIHLERRGSQDSQPDEALVAGEKRKSRKSKKIRHKITAIVDVENPSQMPVLVEKDENATTPALKDVKAKPKFTFNVDSVEEHDEVNKIFKLPKKKSIKKTTKTKDPAQGPTKKAQAKSKTYISTAEIFTFSQQSIEANQEEMLHESAHKKLEKQMVQNVEPPKPSKAKVSSVDIPKPGSAILSKVQPKEKKQEMNFVDSPKPVKANVSSMEEPKPENAILSKVEPKEKKELKSIESSKPLTAKVAPVDTPKAINATLSNVKQQEKKLKTPSPPKDATLKASASLELTNKKQNLSTTTILEKSQSLQVECGAMSAEKSTSQESPSSPPAAVFQSSVSLDIGYNSTPKEVSKQLGKAQSSNAEPGVATPKPIRKGIQKSESGEDFWSQIGTRETIYMTNRKKSLHEIQWQKVEEDDPQSEETKPLSPATPTTDIKSTVVPKKKTPPNKKEEKVTKKATPEKKKSPLAKTPMKPVASTTAQNDVFQKIASQNEVPAEKSTPTVAKLTETSTPTKNTTATATTTTTSPKINTGQKAKSPEHQTNSTSASTPFSINENQQQIPINTTLTSATTATPVTSATAKFDNVPSVLASKTLSTAATTAATTTSPKTTSKTSIITPQAAPSVEKHLQPETTAINKVTEGSKTEVKCTSDPKSPIDSEKPKLPLAKPKATAKSPATTSSPISTQQTSSTPINADHFIMVAPPTKAAIKANAATSPTINKAKKTSSPAKAGGTHQPQQLQQQEKTKAAATTSDKSKATTPTTIIPAAATATASKTTATTANVATTPAEIPSAAKIATENRSESKESGSNLSKFATVSNLAQCLQDVDADIEDYISSSAELSEDDSNLSDISSPDGCENLSASMKKKLKMKKKKERKAEKARFDPQKKVKIDVTNKCYVKEEAPRFPLVATPRPLWRREKIDYPDEDTDSESESDTGSTEETTEDSEECTTSEEYDDDLGGAASGGATSTSKDNVSIIRMSTCSNDSGFEGGTAPSSPKKMLDCEVNCHKKCERLTANLCGVNQKLIVEALAHVKRDAREARDSPSIPPSANPAYEIDTNVEENDETSYTYSEFQKSGRFTAPATVIPRFKDYCVDDFHFLAVLGKGSFGKVLLAELRDTTYYYAVKCLKKDVVLEDDDVDSTLIERKVLALGTKHPYLCHLFCTFQTESHLFFVMEYLNGGDLMFHIQESGRFTEERARFYGAEIISGLKFLHKKGIIYRDLKLDNVLLDYEGHVRIADFGMCKLQIYLDKTADSFCGTPDYMAPEIIKGEKYNQNVDWWSFGVLLYEMLIGQSPFSGCDEDELFWSICNEIPWFPVYISKDAMSILKGLLEKDYTKRIGTHYSPAGDVKDHKFFRPIDWGLLEKRELKPPFRPKVNHPLDTQYFDRVFTKERVRLTPIDNNILQSMDQKQFLGFTYTNPHIALD